MDPTTSVVLTGVIVTAGTWAEGKPLTMRLAIGAVFLTLGLSALNQANAKLASSFAALILVAAALRYIIPIVNKTGIAKTK
jgi:hypothetical protein